MNVSDIIDAVKQHAVENYEYGGWDFIVECWTDKEIEADIKENKLYSADKAIAWFGEFARTMNERRADVRAEIF